MGLAKRSTLTPYVPFVPSRPTISGFHTNLYPLPSDDMQGLSDVVSSTEYSNSRAA